MILVWTRRIPICSTGCLPTMPGHWWITTGTGTHVGGILIGNGAKSLTVSNARGSINPATTNQYRGMAPGRNCSCKISAWGWFDGGCNLAGKCGADQRVHLEQQLGLHRRQLVQSGLSQL